MKAKHRKVLQAIFEDPARANIAWADIEALFVAAGAEISEGRGSRVQVALNGVRAFTDHIRRRKLTRLQSDPFGAS